MKRVTGLGGIFFKVNDVPQMREWYQKHLGLDIAPQGYSVFPWRDDADPNLKCASVWSLFPAETTYFAPGDAPYMINYRVENLDALLDALRAEGVWVDDKREDSTLGKFGWIRDPEGRRIELWEPPPDNCG
jgi:catechol 2,3-dioxygenase-like lactoylglutathione lyase family enzyme